jgi:hypothetical protein
MDKNITGKRQVIEIRPGYSRPLSKGVKLQMQLPYLLAHEKISFIFESKIRA